jgi:hypothetical protein
MKLWKTILLALALSTAILSAEARERRTRTHIYHSSDAEFSAPASIQDGGRWEGSSARCYASGSAYSYSDAQSAWVQACTHLFGVVNVQGNAVTHMLAALSITRL